MVGGPGSGGHNRKSNEQKMLEGDPGRRLVREKPPRKPSGAGKRHMSTQSNFPTSPASSPIEILRPPLSLTALAKRMWRLLAPELLKAGALDIRSQGILEGYCVAYATERQAQAVIDSEGLTQVARHGMSPRPEVKIARESRMQRLAYGKELGLTPKSRGISISPSALAISKQPRDPMEEILNNPPNMN